MRYLLGRLFRQNKFPVKFIDTSLFFPWLLVFYNLTDAFALVLFMSSTSHPHPRCRSSCSQMFFKIGVPKIFPNFTGKHRCFPVKFAKCFFFYFSLAALPLLPYSTVTFFVWRNTFVFISLLLHHYCHNSWKIHQDCCDRYDLLYCHFHDSYTC